MRKYFAIMSANVKRNLIHRMRTVIWFLVDTVGIIVLPFIWLSIYAGQETIGNLTKPELITYYSVVFLVSLLAVSHTGGYIADEIRTGRINKYLVMPFSYLWMYKIRELSFKLIMGTFGIVVFIIAKLLLPEYILFPTLSNFFLFLVFLLFARIVSFCLEAIVGLGTFWMENNGAANQLRFILERTFGGEFAPLTLFPLIFQKVALLLPFQFIYFIPAQVYLGKVSISDLFTYFGLGILWIVALTGIITFMWRRGVRKYDGVGM